MPFAISWEFRCKRGAKCGGNESPSVGRLSGVERVAQQPRPRFGTRTLCGPEPRFRNVAPPHSTTFPSLRVLVKLTCVSPRGMHCVCVIAFSPCSPAPYARNRRVSDSPPFPTRRSPDSPHPPRRVVRVPPQTVRHETAIDR